MLYLARDGQEGLEVLRHEAVDLVVSDLGVPGNRGLEFLGQVREFHPEVDRVLLGADHERRDLNRAITRGFATASLSLPWEDAHLRNCITHHLEVRDTLKNRKLLETVNEIHRLPTLPRIYQEFLEALFEDRSASEIARIVDRDVSIATRLIQVANSAYYGSVCLCSVEGAVVRLGLNAVKDMVLTLSLVREMEWTAKQLRMLDEIFRRSARVNRVLRDVYRHREGRHLDPDLASVGLIHDIGRILILQFFPERYASTLTRMEQDEGRSFYESELDLGYRWFMHEELGAYFLNLWNMPEIMVEATLYHHRPEGAGEDTRALIEALHVADLLVSHAELHPGEPMGDDLVEASGMKDVPLVEE